MGRIILVTGGCRSGKSAYAQKRVEAMPGRHVYLATAGVYDGEMRARVERHRAERAGRGWDTVEAPAALAEAVLAAGMAKDTALLVDCLTLWATNRFFADDGWERATEDDAASEAVRLVGAARQAMATTVFVTNEVGWGVVPENAMARRFRDMAGRVNQVVAHGADEVVLVACGLPLTFKG